MKKFIMTLVAAVFIMFLHLALAKRKHSTARHEKAQTSPRH